MQRPKREFVLEGMVIAADDAVQLRCVIVCGVPHRGTAFGVALHFPSLSLDSVLELSVLVLKVFQCSSMNLLDLPPTPPPSTLLM